MAHPGCPEIILQSELEHGLFLEWMYGQSGNWLLLEFPFTFTCIFMRNRPIFFNLFFKQKLLGAFGGVFPSGHEREEQQRRSEHVKAPSADDVLADSFRALGLVRGCTVGEARKAFHKLALKNHPDKNRDDPAAAAAKMTALNAAYELVRATFRDEGLESDGDDSEGDEPTARQRRGAARAPPRAASDDDDDDKEWREEQEWRARRNKDRAKFQHEKQKYSGPPTGKRGAGGVLSRKNAKKKAKQLAKKREAASPPEGEADGAADGGAPAPAPVGGADRRRAPAAVAIAIMADAPSILVDEFMKLFALRGPAALVEPLDEDGNTLLHYGVMYDRAFAINLAVRFAGEAWPDAFLRPNLQGKLPCECAGPDAECKNRVEELTTAARTHQAKAHRSFDWRHALRLLSAIAGAALPLQAILAVSFSDSPRFNWSIAAAVATMAVATVGPVEDPIAPSLYWALFVFASFAPSVRVYRTAFYPGWILALPWLYVTSSFLMRGMAEPDKREDDYEDRMYFMKYRENRPPDLSKQVHACLLKLCDALASPRALLLRIGGSRLSPGIATFATGLAMWAACGLVASYAK
ncbi:hypothetical protein M885DRAFT_525499 [Pelagophyceae sp. CCMP2097]|nr:hypothetical protein M885DRAFT_525499 [Pelagophyceae sp. CCMP2097]